VNARRHFALPAGPLHSDIQIKITDAIAKMGGPAKPAGELAAV
jgi:hypothetical protein